MKLSKAIGRLLSKKLKESGKTKADIEREAKMNSKTVAKVFNGCDSASVKNYEKVSGCFGIKGFNISEF